MSKKYKVVDEFCCEIKYFDDLNEAKEEAFNVQGVLYEDDVFLFDYGVF